MTLLIPKGILDSKIMCLDNNPKRPNLISAASLPIISFHISKCIRLFSSEVLSTKKNQSILLFYNIINIYLLLYSKCINILIIYFIYIYLLYIIYMYFIVLVFFFKWLLSNLFLALQVYFAPMGVHQTLREY